MPVRRSLGPSPQSVEGEVIRVHHPELVRLPARQTPRLREELFVSVNADDPPDGSSGTVENPDASGWIAHVQPTVGPKSEHPRQPDDLVGFRDMAARVQDGDFTAAIEGDIDSLRPGGQPDRVTDWDGAGSRVISPA